MNNLALVTWTNTEMEDVFAIYFGNFEKYFPQIEKSYVFINKLSEVINDKHLQLCCEESNTYANRLLFCLEFVEEDYILYMQEDFILYDYVDLNEFDRCFQYLKDSDCSCLRFIKSDLNSLNDEVEKNIYKISHNKFPDLSFTQQASIWKKEHFIRCIEKLNPNTFRDLESYGTYNASLVMKQLGYFSCFYFDQNLDKDLKRGGHYDCNIFPYIATAITKGKWNYFEYSQEIENICNEYSIDVNKRGILK